MGFTTIALAPAAPASPWSDPVVMLSEVILWLLLRLLRQPGEKKCLQFLWLLESSSSFSAHPLPTVGLQQMVQTVNSKTVDMSNTMKSNAL